MAWASSQTPLSKTNTVVGTTGTSQAFGSNVTAGHVVVAASLWATSTSVAPTFTDTSSNVTSWTSTGTNVGTAAVCQVAIAWGIATSTAACTPKVTWASAASAIQEIFIGEFSASGAVSGDGALAFDNHAASTLTITTPTGNGAQSGDLMIAMVGPGGSFTTWGGSWVAMGPSTGNDAGYLLNVAGNSAVNANQSPSAPYASLLIALQAAAGTGIPDLIMAPAHR